MVLLLGTVWLGFGTWCSDWGLYGWGLGRGAPTGDCMAGVWDVVLLLGTVWLGFGTQCSYWGLYGWGLGRDAPTGDCMAGVWGLAVELAVHRGGRRVWKMKQGSFEVCHSMGSLLSLSH